MVIEAVASIVIVIVSCVHKRLLNFIIVITVRFVTYKSSSRASFLKSLYNNSLRIFFGSIKPKVSRLLPLFVPSGNSSVVIGSIVELVAPL